jgi:anthranilate/para-aminobenzoate synthase component II
VAEEDKEIMALKHKKYPIEGVQFHPESVMTLEGPKILLNFLSMIKR